MLKDTGEDMPEDLRFAQIDKEGGARVEIDLNEPPIVVADGWKEIPKKRLTPDKEKKPREHDSVVEPWPDHQPLHGEMRPVDRCGPK